MDAQNYINQIHELASRLESDGRFKVVFEAYPPMRAGNLEDMENQIKSEPGMEGFEILAPFREFYLMTNGFRLRWQYLGHDDPQRITTGSTRIVSPIELYQPDEEEGEPFSLMYERLRIFDDMGELDNVAMQHYRNSASPKLLYKCQDIEGVHELGLDFNSYLELMLQARAMYRWQQFFIVDEIFRPLPEVEEQFRSDMMLLFPEVDLSPFTSKR